MKKLLRRIIRLLIVAVILGGGYYAGSIYLWPPPDLTTVKAVGIVEAPEVNITSRIAGRIARLDLVEGDRVKKGEVICQIEDIDLKNQLRHAEAEVEKARVDLADAQRTERRDAVLVNQGIISTKEHDDALTRVGDAQAALQSALANVKYYQDQLTDTHIISPIDGVVVSKDLQVGEWVTPGTPIVTVDDLSTIWARVDVQETDLHGLRVGAPAVITLPGNPPVHYSGQVMAIGQEGEFATQRDVRRGRQDIRTFYVKVRALQADGDLKPGMTAEVDFPRNDGIRLSSNQRSGAY